MRQIQQKRAKNDKKEVLYGDLLHIVFERLLNMRRLNHEIPFIDGLRHIRCMFIPFIIRELLPAGKFVCKPNSSHSSFVIG